MLGSLLNQTPTQPSPLQGEGLVVYCPCMSFSLAPNARVLCVGLNYRDHAIEGSQPIPEFPVFFVRFPSSFVRHGEQLILPKVSTRYDYEAELAVVIGKAGRHIPREQALSHVRGYTIGMDGSVRDWQKRTPQWTLGKNFDKSGAIGPELVDAAKLPPGAAGLAVQARINGELLQNGNTTDMIFHVAELISTLSTCMELQPGDVILTGTPAGVGFARKPPVYLKAGDKVEITIEKIGTLANTVIAE